MWSGGSTASTSLIWFAIKVGGETVRAGRLLVGSSVIDEKGEPLTPKLWGEPLGHSIVNELPLAFTGSLKLTVMLLLGSTAVAPLAGLVLVTVGALSVVKEKL